MNCLKKIFGGIIVALALATAVNTPVMADIEMPIVGNVGDATVGWFTPENRTMLTTTLTHDLTEFQTQMQPQLVQDYVPIEAKAGLALMNALSLVGDILDNSLVRFVIIFMIIAYVFWIMFDAYNMMTRGSSARDFAENAIKKGAVMAIWIIILRFGAPQVFMWIMGPIIGVGTYMADLILNAVTAATGVQIPDTCAAIHEYAQTHTSARMLLDADTAADILCVPTRLSGFCTTAIVAGWKWMIAGIGTSAFSVIGGAACIVLFTYCAFKFALMALGVITDLFLAVLMLPFTAIAESVPKTSYKGIAGNIFNSFMGLFKAESLQTQIQRFITAAVYFVALAIVIALCAALLAGVVDADLAGAVPSLNNTGFIVILLTGVLVAYLAATTDDIIKDLGAKVAGQDNFVNQLVKDAEKLWAKASSKWKQLRGK